MKKLLKKTFQQKYSRENFTKFLAQTFQKSENDFEFQRVFPDNEKEKYYDTRHLLSFKTDDKKTIEVLTIELKTKSNIENARGYQRGLIEKYIKNRIHQSKWVDGVLVAFWSDYECSWRLSFVVMDLKNGKKEFTPFKRHSFLVGENEATHTAEQQFFEILKTNKTPLFSQLLEVFSVEKVTNEFFEEYKKHFLSLNDKFLENETFQKEVVEKQGVKNADFVKKLMGQVVFLYFLQKKGWLGVEQDKKWGTGDKNFMRKLFNECLNGGDSNKERGGKNFFNDYLEHLFYDALNNKDRGGASVLGDYSWTKYFQCRIPYLNGGLFEPVYEWEKTYIDIPNNVFEELFNTFDRYNFTVYESDNLETDVAVDPEMLGKVFENLLEIDERKGKGAFYTPREIVHYMCQESLINYLINASGHKESRIRKLMNRKDQITAKSEKEKKSIEEDQDIKDMGKEINNLLKTVTVCDPAVGSGAFPMGMLKEIVSLRFFLNQFFVKAKHEKTGKFLNEYDIKKETLENCIYGVDIEPGAIEICRLRFWLSMVVEHDIEEVEPLPNLDYKLMQGNSLLENLVIGDNVIKLNIDSGNKGDKRTKEMKNLLEEESQGVLLSMDSHLEVREKLQKLHTEFFDQTDPREKKRLKSKIDKYENLFIETACNDEINRLESVIKNSRDLKQKEAENQIVLIKQTLEKWRKDHIRPFFPWKLHFGEIFKDGGFDIVIGNPPYIQLQKSLSENSNKKLGDLYEKEDFKTFAKTGDIYCLFYEKGNQLLRKKGILSFITSNKWMRAGYGEKLREFLTNETQPLQLLDLGGGIFETATVDTNVLLFQKETFAKNFSACTLTKKDTGNLMVGFAEKAVKIKPQGKESWTILSPIEQQIKTKIEAIGTPLKEWDIEIYRGVLTGYNEAFIIDGAKKDELIAKDPKSREIIKPLLRGRDIKRYKAEFADKWLIATHNGYKTKDDEQIENININDYPAIKEHLDTHWEKIEARQDQGDTPYNLRSCAYYEAFEKEKIIYGQFREGSYHFKKDHCFLSSNEYLITSDSVNLKYLIALMNSKLSYYYLSMMANNLGGNTSIAQKNILITTPIPLLPEAEQQPFVAKVNAILELKESGEDTSILENEIDEMVFDLYGLTEAEKAVIWNN